MIIVAAYPASEEMATGFSLAPNSVSIRGPVDKPNAGRFVQYSIISAFDNDPNFPAELKPFYKRIGFTNMIKCSPFTQRHEKLKVTDKHIRACKNTWLEREIAVVSKYNPTCPIMLCGGEAAKLLGPNMKVYSNRRQQFIYNGTHPCIITFNPVEAVRYTAYAITESDIDHKGRTIIQEAKPERPAVIGSTTWHWKQDIDLMKKLVLANYSNRFKDDSYTLDDLMEYVNAE